MTATVQDDILALMAKRLDAYRKERYLSMEEFADLLGCTPATLYRIIQGKSQPRPSTMRRFAERLEVHPSDIEEFVHKPEDD